MNPSYYNKILELNSRKTVYDLVKKHPGCHFRDLERKSKIPASSLKYHLNYLSRYGLISEQKDGIKIRYFTEEFNSQNKVLLSLLRQESIRRILLFLLADSNNQSNHESIAGFVQLSPSTISWHLRKLESKNIIKSVRKGKNNFYTLLIDKKEILGLLINYKESFLDSLVNKTIEMWDI